MATKLEGSGGNTLVAGPLFLRLPFSITYSRTLSDVDSQGSSAIKQQSFENKLEPSDETKPAKEEYRGPHADIDDHGDDAGRKQEKVRYRYLAVKSRVGFLTN